MWGLFGWKAETNPVLGRLEMKRYFGRYTKVSVDADRDGRADMEAEYTWAEPFTWSEPGPCGGKFQRKREDLNRDGQWDAWTWPLAATEDRPCGLRLEADTNADGKPDWSREIFSSRDSESAYLELKNAREL